jgi:DNA-binding transcriptional LysR family regulator
VIDYYRSDPLIHRWIEHHAADGARVRPDVRIWAATTDLVLELVLGGSGVAVLPRSLVERELARKRLHAITTPHGELADTVWLDELRGAAETRGARALREAVVGQLTAAPAS